MSSLDGRVVGFVGLGNMGHHLAGHLHREGASVRVFNRSPGKVTAWLREHPDATGVSSPGEAAAGADYVVTCVGDDEDLREVYLSETGLVGSLRPDACVIDHTTASDSIARTLESAVGSAGGWFVDAPVSGGTEGARNGRLSIMAGGSEDAFDRARPVLDVYGAVVNLIGPGGSGQLCKLVNQVCLAGIMQGLAEGLGLARAAGLDTERVLRSISGGTARSWPMENRAGFMLSGEYPAGFAVRHMLKDLTLGLAAATDRELDLPAAELVRERYASLLRDGFGDEDLSNLFRLTGGDAAGADPVRGD